MTGPRVRHEVHYGRMMRCFADRPANIWSMFASTVARRPDGVALICDDIRIAYRELHEQAASVACGLAARGLRRGDRLALLVGNRIEFMVSVLAAARIGAAIVPLNVRQRKPEIRYALAHSEAAMLIFDAALSPELPAPADTPLLRERFSVGESVAGAGGFQELLENDGEIGVWAEVDEEQPFCILYTSGTTGKPKGAVLTHLGVIHSVLHYEHAFGLRDGDVAALAVPASHVTGLVAIILPMLRVAGTSVIIADFKASAFLGLVSSERVNYSLLVPAMYNLCLRTETMLELDLSAWRIGGYGGAPMPVATIERLAEALPGLALSNIYGATETSSPVSILPSEFALTHSDTVGLPLPCADIRVLDDDFHELAPGERGELYMGGPMVIPGYWRDSAADERSFIAGYWRSGDVGSMDEAGFLRIHDRTKDVINRGGYKIYCIEVENVIAQLDEVIECAVVGYSDAVLGERVAVFARIGGEAAGADALIRRHCLERLSDYKVPEEIIIRHEPLPRNANGKILKPELSRQLAERRAAAASLSVTRE